MSRETARRHRCGPTFRLRHRCGPTFRLHFCTGSVREPTCSSANRDRAGGAGPVQTGGSGFTSDPDHTIPRVYDANIERISSHNASHAIGSDLSICEHRQLWPFVLACGRRVAVAEPQPERFVFKAVYGPRKCTDFFKVHHDSLTTSTGRNGVHPLNDVRECAPTVKVAAALAMDGPQP